MYKYNMKNIEYGMWYVILTAGTNDKGTFITGEAGTGKTTTANKLKSQLRSRQYKICTPTHKSSLLYDDAQTIYSIFIINQHSRTYLRSAVDKPKTGA
jgi:nucleoside-triphosphatase THEP1